MNSAMRDVMEQAEVLSEELVNILLKLSASGRAFEADESLRQALAELSSFRGRSSADDIWVDHLRRSRELVKKAIDLVQDASMRESLKDAESFMGSLHGAAIDRVVEADARTDLSSARIPGASDRDPYLASNGTPACQRGITIAAPRLFAGTRLADPTDDDPENDDNDDNQTEVTPTRNAHHGKSRGGTPRERMMIEALARDAMEDLGAFANLRLCFDNEPWTNAEPFEKRLLACLDALTSTARPVVPGRAELDLAEALYGYATEWSVPDRGRAFGFAFALACLPQDTALLWVEMGLRSADVRVHPAYIDALSLAQSPSINDRVRGLLGGDVPRDLMIVGLQTAIRRRFFHPGTMLPLLAHPDNTVAELATLATCHAKTAMMVEALAARDGETRPVVRATQGLVLALHGESRGRIILKSLVATVLAARDEAAGRRILRGLAILGNDTDHEDVWRLAELTRRYRDVGFFGHAPHVTQLFAVVKALDLRMMESPEPGMVDIWRAWSDDAAVAIHRISNVELPRFGSGRFEVEPGEALVNAWRPALAGRLRRDATFTRLDVVAEMLDPRTLQGDRAILADELTLHSSGEYRFDVSDWVLDQRTFLEAARAAWDR